MRTEEPGANRSAASRHRFGWVVVPALIFAAMTGMFALALTSGDPSKLPSALIGKPVPGTQFAPVPDLTADGRAVSGFTSADLGKGEVTVVNFWASWCAPCVAEHPHLVDLANRTGVRLFGVNYKDDPAAARRFLGRYGNPFAAVGADPSGRGAIEWGVYGMPETFVIDGAGRIAHKHVGPLTAASLAEVIIPALDRARAATSKAPAR
ncbi:MAG: DsbE family thiol:disulfide interchange protein [Hyphomicrobiaceae bacterium]|nr:DsbE family thiol:disulfide interchange protein [Hyphomicrobiaceae bacterium]